VLNVQRSYLAEQDETACVHAQLALTLLDIKFSTIHKILFPLSVLNQKSLYQQKYLPLSSMKGPGKALLSNGQVSIDLLRGQVDLWVVFHLGTSLIIQFSMENLRKWRMWLSMVTGIRPILLFQNPEVLPCRPWRDFVDQHSAEPKSGEITWFGLSDLMVPASSRLNSVEHPWMTPQASDSCSSTIKSPSSTVIHYGSYFCAITSGQRGECGRHCDKARIWLAPYPARI